MKIIVTGATSFIGKNTVRALEKAGMDVCALRHSFEEAGSIPENADIWIHFAWAGKGSEGRKDEGIQAENVRMSLRALMKARELNVKRFLFAGSQAEYSLGSAYGRAKKEFGIRAAEWLKGCGSSMEFVHMRIYSVYGPGDHENSLASTLVKNALSGSDMNLGPCTQLWNYTYIDDAVKAVVLLVNAERAGGIMDIAGDDTRPLCDYVKEAWNLLSAPGNLYFGIRSNNAEGAADLVPDTEKLRGMGYKADVSFGEGIRIMAGELL